MAQYYGNFSAKTVAETVVGVTTGAWTSLPTTALAGRHLVEVYNKGENKLYLSFDNTAVIKHRAAIGSGETRIFPIQDNLTLYGRSQSGGNRVIVTEFR
ncbi:hypothetical protein LCGC14_2976740 [marine sediment metagenome]|uniref:Uncharacterized protein n=1 Tax=marine sediment metagenome TaxID=412755 RepID=A0A0F8XV72_9ZZZZ